MLVRQPRLPAAGVMTTPVAPGTPEQPKLRQEATDGYFERLGQPGPDKETSNEREARRLAARLPEGYVPMSGADLTFDPRIAYELALALDTPLAIFTKYGVAEVDARLLIANPLFIGTVKKYKEEVTTTGISFKLKAKIQAEDLLTHSYILATDPEVPAAVRADLIKWTAKMAGLEPDTKDKGSGGAAGGFTLNITLAGPSGGAGEPLRAAIDVTPTAREIT